MRKVIRVCPEYFCYCLWEVFEDGDVENISAGRLPISSTLKSEIESWEDLYESTYCDDDPGMSGFKSSKEEIDFWGKGLMLQRSLQNELGDDCKVIACIELKMR